MGVAFSTGIDHHQPARLDHAVMAVAVEDFPVLGKDCGEARPPSLAQGDAFHFSHYLLLYASRADAATRRGVHLISQIAGLFYQGYLPLLLDETKRDDRPHQSFRSRSAALLAGREHFRRIQTKKRRQHRGVVVSGCRQEMHLPGF